MNSSDFYKIPLRRKFLLYTAQSGPTPPPPPPPLVKWLDVTRTDGLAESDRAAIAVFKAAGLCENDDYMTTEEAAAVVQLPRFLNVTALVNWDWSALSGMINTSLKEVFSRCLNVAFTILPEGFASQTNDLQWAFYNCANLALTSLPAGFGSVATEIREVFFGCTNLALTSLPAGFGLIATDLRRIFTYCKKLELTSLQEGFAANANMESAFYECSKLALTSLPASFGTSVSYKTVFYRCTNLRGAFNINNANFGKNASIFSLAFMGTAITSFIGGYFDFSSVNSDTLVTSTSAAIEQFVPTTCTHVMFVANTLKHSLVNSAANLTNIDTESLLSLAECLSSSASGKTWTVTSAQFDTLMSEMYSETLSYIMYVMMKGWNVEAA